MTIGTQLGKLNTPYGSNHRRIYQQRIARFLFNLTHHGITSIIHLSVRFDLSRNVCFVCIVMGELYFVTEYGCRACLVGSIVANYVFMSEKERLKVLRQLLSGPGNVSTMFARRVGVTGTNEMLSIIATERRQIVTTTAEVALRVRPVCIT